MEKVLCIVHDGFEDIEATTTLDLFKRVKIPFDICSVQNQEYVKGAHNVILPANVMIKDLLLEQYHTLFIPGGPHVKALSEDDCVEKIIKHFVAHEKRVFAICAAPSLLGRLNLLEGKTVTCFPGFETYMYHANVTFNSVEIDGLFVTGKGAGVTTEFALACVGELLGDDAKQRLAEGIQYA